MRWKTKQDVTKRKLGNEEAEQEEEEERKQREGGMQVLFFQGSEHKAECGAQKTRGPTPLSRAYHFDSSEHVLIARLGVWSACCTFLDSSL